MILAYGVRFRYSHPWIQRPAVQRQEGGGEVVMERRCRGRRDGEEYSKELLPSDLNAGDPSDPLFANPGFCPSALAATKIATKRWPIRMDLLRNGGGLSPCPPPVERWTGKENFFLKKP